MSQSNLIINETTKLFYAQNSEFNLMTANLYKDLDSLNWEGIDKESTVNEIKAQQRILKLCQDIQTAKILLDNGINSAHKIAAVTEEQFVEKYLDVLNIDEETIREIYRNAADIKAKAMHLWASIKTACASPFYKNLKSNRNLKQLLRDTPSYEELFGDTDYYEVEEADSIYGPAAYLTDLLRIVDQYVANVPQGLKLDDRRPDINQIKLTAENTNTTIPYLQIVNEVLGAYLKRELNVSDEFKFLAQGKYPFNVPFNLPLEQIRTYLAEIKINLEDIFKAFDKSGSNELGIAREVLKLSIEELNLITDDSIEASFIMDSFGFSNTEINEIIQNGKIPVKVFLERTQLTKKELLELLYQDLSESELTICSKFYINIDSGMNEYLSIVTDENNEDYEMLINLSMKKLNHLSRFIRFARKLNWSFIDLDWVLTSIGAVDIDEAAIISISKIKILKDKFNVPLTTLCSLWFDIKTIGEGSGSYSKACFDVLFNTPELIKKRGNKVYHPKTFGNANPLNDSKYHNELYTDPLLQWNWAEKSIPTAELEAGKSIVIGGIRTSYSNIVELASLMFDSEETVTLSVSNLSILARHVTFSSLLGLKLPEYLTLLKILNKSTSKVININDINYISEIFDVIKKTGFNVYEIQYILDGIESPYVNVKLKEEKLSSFATALQTLMKGVYIAQNTFINSENGIEVTLSEKAYNYLLAIGMIDSYGIVLVNDMSLEYFKQNYDALYNDFLTFLTEVQADFIIDKVFQKKNEQKNKLIEQLVSFFNSNTDLMLVLYDIAEKEIVEVDFNFVKLFADYSSDSEKFLQDTVYSFMKIISRYTLLSKKLKLDAKELESISIYYKVFDIDDFKALTIDDIKTIYDFKQLTAELDDKNYELLEYLMKISGKRYSEDLEAYTLRLFRQEEINRWVIYARSSLEKTYLSKTSFINEDTNINEELSKELFQRMQDTGIIDDTGIVLLEELSIEKFKQDYNVLYEEVFKDLPEKSSDYVLNIVFAKGQEQKNKLTNMLAAFFCIDIALMRSLIEIASIVMIEYAQNWVELFTESTSFEVARRFINVIALYFVLAKKLGLESSELVQFVSKNYDKDIIEIRELNLDDLQDINEFKVMVDEICNDNYGFTGSFKAINKDSVVEGALELLSNLTGWDKEEVKELAGYFFDGELLFSLKEIYTLKKCFDLSKTLGTNIFFLGELLSIKDLNASEWEKYTSYSTKVMETLKARYSLDSWNSVYLSIKNTIEEKKRNILLSTVLWKVRTKTYGENIKEPRDLYGFFLIDVEMGECAQISYIKAAINSVQLYLQRCRLNLEDEAKFYGLKDAWWEWMMNYRVWQANRKVFLYPENYIDPSLRKSKTTLFKNLEDSLMQADITQESIEAAFTKYLDDFSKLASLKYTDSYFCTVEYPNRGPIDTLFLFSVTQEQPYTFYYCTRESRMVKDGAGKYSEINTWTEWIKIDLAINSKYITPVFAYNRLFIFWVETKKISDPKSNDKKNTIYKTAIKYSFYNFSGKWAPIQTLSEDNVIYVSQDNYSQKVVFGDGTSVITGIFDMENILWQKVYALKVSEDNYENVPEGTLTSEKIVIIYGPLLTVILSKEKLAAPVPGSNESDNEKYTFEENIYEKVNNYNGLILREREAYLPIMDAVILNGKLKDEFLLRSSEFLTVGRKETGDKTIIKMLLDRINTSLFAAYSDSAIKDNYISDDTVDILYTVDLALINEINNTLAVIIITKLYNKGMINRYGRLRPNVTEPAVQEALKALLLSSNTIRKVYDALKNPVLLFSNTARSNVRIITVKNQPDMFIFDNGDETFLLTLDLSNLSSERRGLQISKHLKVSSPVTSIGREAFMSIPVDFNTSSSIYNCLINKGLVGTGGKLQSIFSGYLIEAFHRNGERFDNNQAELVLGIIQQNVNYLDSDSFICESISEQTSKEIFDNLSFDGILNGEGKVNASYVTDKDGLIISICTASLNLLEIQVTRLKQILGQLDENTTVNRLFFADYIINRTLANDIFQKLDSRRLIVFNYTIHDYKMIDDFFDNKQYLVIEKYLEAMSLTEQKINFIKDKIVEAGPSGKLNPSSFVNPAYMIDEIASNQIFDNLRNKGLIDGNGGIKSDFFNDTNSLIIKFYLYDVVLTLTSEQLEALLHRISEYEKTTVINPISFVVCKIIDEGTSNNIFNKFTERAVIEDNKFISRFYSDKQYLILSLSLKIPIEEDENNDRVDIVRARLQESMVPLNIDSFIVDSIDIDTSSKVFLYLKGIGIIDNQGMVSRKNPDARDFILVSESLKACGINLSDEDYEKIRLIISERILALKKNSFVKDAWNIHITLEKSTSILRLLQSKGIVDNNGMLTPNISKNTNLFAILKDRANVDEIKYIKGIIQSIFTPVFLDLELDVQNPEINIDQVKFKTTRLTTAAIEHLSQRLFTGGLDSLLSLEAKDVPADAKLYFSRLGGNTHIISPEIECGEQVDFDGPYGNYYWELFFHAPMLVADKLNSNQKFSAAKKWYEYIFNPIIDTGEYWRFKPLNKDNIEKLVDMLNNGAEIAAYNDEPFDPHAIARLRIGAYEKAVVMKYIDNLLDWGDYLFSQYTWESITEATMLYIYAYDILGNSPENHGPIKKRSAITFQNIKDEYERKGLDIPQFLIEVENMLISSNVTISTLDLLGKPFNDIYTYFPVPENMEFVSYWTRVEDRLFKIRHCMNINGQKQQLSLFEPEIDVLQLVRAAASGNNVIDVLAYSRTSMPCYRFSYLLDKAKSVTATLMQLGSSMLAALEKNDVEALVLLRSANELNILNMTTTIKEKQIEEIDENLNALKISLEGAGYRYNRYKEYIDGKLNEYEKNTQNLLISSLAFQSAASLIRIVAAAAYLIPNIFGLAAGGMNYGKAVESGATILELTSSVLDKSAGVTANMGEFVRREEEWVLQMNSAEYEREQIAKTIEANEVRKVIAEQELEIHKKGIEQALEEEEFLKNKFSSKDLYNWMVGRIAIVYFQTYRLALEMALDAQKAYQYELALNDSFINLAYWDSLKKGLLSGENLMFSLEQMERSYTENNTRMLEIEKTISLAQLDPEAFIKFKYGGEGGKKGQCEFELKEELLDYDFPGHYCRQIKTVSISIPAVVGPYQNINATLTQISNAVITVSDIGAVEFLITKGKEDSQRPSSSVLRENWVPNQKIAISKGIDDNGMFTLNFNDDRYLPFEGTGAVSKWKISMPPETNRINFESISDIIIKISYCAKDGGEAFAEEIKSKLSSIGVPYTSYKYFELKRNFPSSWQIFINNNSQEDNKKITFTLGQSVLQPNIKNPMLESIYLLLETEDNILVSDSLVEGNFLELKINNTESYPISIVNNIGIVDIESTNFLGNWTFEFDMKKSPAKILFGTDKLLDIKVVTKYRANLF